MGMMFESSQKEIETRYLNANYYYNYALKTLVSVLGFEPVEDYHETYELIKAIRFEKQEEGSIHQVVLEDHREDEDIKDWLIFSELKDDDTNWFGQKINSPYPLTLSELTAFGTFIKAFQNCKEVASEIKLNFKET